MAKVDVPQHLRPVAKFAPTKRARLGGAQVVAGLRDSANFRTAVVEWLRKNRPSTLEVTSPDPVTAAAAAVLTGDDVAPHYVELVSRRVGDATLRAERDTAVDARGTDGKRAGAAAGRAQPSSTVPPNASARTPRSSWNVCASGCASRA